MAAEYARPRAEFSELVEVMARLRDECPWDRSQTHRSLVTYLVEETGEVIDAIEAGTDDDLVEELGDLLLQVVFHSRIGEQGGRFDINEVVGGIVAKLVARHPYVFSDEEVPEDLDAAWEARKAAAKGRTSSLDGSPTPFPAWPAALRSSHGHALVGWASSWPTSRSPRRRLVTSL